MGPPILALALSMFAIPVSAQTPSFQQCIGRSGPPPVSFNPATDLGYLLGRIAAYSADPGQLYGPGPWTNWYLEADQRDGLAKLAVGRGITDQAALWNI